MSNAYNRPERLSATLRSAILATARELGYFGPDPKARALRRRELQTVGVVFDRSMTQALTDANSRALLAGIASELDRRRLWMQFIPRLEREFGLEAAFQSTADAMIVNSQIGPDLTHDVIAAPKPIVLVDSFLPDAAYVRADDRRGGMLAMQHALAASPDFVVVLCSALTAVERARILDKVLPPRSRSATGERLAGYALAARRADFPFDRIAWLDPDEGAPDSVPRQLAELQARIPRRARLAVLGMSDHLALAAISASNAWRGRKVVAVVGFGDIPAAAAAGLTTIRQDSFRKGEIAVRILLDGQESMTMPVELVVRRT